MGKVATGISAVMVGIAYFTWLDAFISGILITVIVVAAFVGVLSLILGKFIKF